MKATTSLVRMCDPPSGWKYGFPKPVPKDFNTSEEFYSWLVSEGYPREDIDRMGNHFYCRYWEEEVELPPHTD
jgi:hypothetical protein